MTPPEKKHEVATNVKSKKRDPDSDSDAHPKKLEKHKKPHDSTSDDRKPKE